MLGLIPGTTLFGMRVFVSRDHPRMQLPTDLPLPDAFRAEFNAWMADFFGWDNVVPDGKAYQIGDTVHMNPRTFVELRKAADIHTCPVR
jgi:hypothetical protein